MIEKIANDVANTGVRATEAALKKAWSFLDAASEKKSPSETLSPQAIKAVQGFQPPAPKQ